MKKAKKNPLQVLHLQGIFCVVPRPGVEPGWVAPLVFETSASTDSAIWASEKCGAKIQTFSELANMNYKKIINTGNY